MSHTIYQGGASSSSIANPWDMCTFCHGYRVHKSFLLTHPSDKDKDQLGFRGRIRVQLMYASPIALHIQRIVLKIITLKQLSLQPLNDVHHLISNCFCLLFVAGQVVYIGYIRSLSLENLGRTFICFSHSLLYTHILPECEFLKVSFLFNTMSAVCR